MLFIMLCLLIIYRGYLIIILTGLNRNICVDLLSVHIEYGYVNIFSFLISLNNSFYI